jgi:hypothetical protein
MKLLSFCAAVAAAVSLSSACSGDGNGDAACRGELAEVGAGCPATFDGTEAALPACNPTTEASQSVWSCQDLIQLVRSSGFDYRSCYYDASSHALVGAEGGTDVATYCGGSLTIEAGRTAPMCRENAPSVMRDCSPTASASP